MVGHFPKFIPSEKKKKAGHHSTREWPPRFLGSKIGRSYAQIYHGGKSILRPSTETRYSYSRSWWIPLEYVLAPDLCIWPLQSMCASNSRMTTKRLYANVLFFFGNYINHNSEDQLIGLFHKKTERGKVESGGWGGGICFLKIKSKRKICATCRRWKPSTFLDLDYTVKKSKQLS